jgi:hypothetical protein
MLDKKRLKLLKINQNVMPMFRYAFGATLIMAFAMAFGGQLAFVIPFLALNFLSPGTKKPTLKQAIVFVLIVAVSSVSALLFTSFLFPYPLVYIPLLALILFGVFYTDRINLISKIFLILSFLAIPVMYPGMNVMEWGSAITLTLIIGSALSILVVWFVYLLFPDKYIQKEQRKAPANKKQEIQDQKERLYNAVGVLLVTFPVVLGFIFFQWNSSILVLTYIVLFTMMSDVGKVQGKIKIYGNIIGGAVTLVFYQMIVIVPNFFFFILLFLGVALLFSTKIFSGKPDAIYYKTAFATLTLVIGNVSIGTENATNEIWLRLLQIFIAVAYMIVGLEIINFYRDKRELKLKYKSQLT